MNCVPACVTGVVPTKQLVAAFKGAPSIDYEELRTTRDRYSRTTCS